LAGKNIKRSRGAACTGLTQVNGTSKPLLDDSGARACS
jgi:hypothetical protein